jgi:phosphoglycerate dehydrogenase-like enzyme
MRDLTIWSNTDLPPAAAALLEEGVRGHRLVGPPPGARIPLGKRGRADPTLGDADVAFGQPEADQVIATPRLRWVHLTSAGYTTFDRDDVRAALRARGGTLTKSSVVFDEPCAQHLLAFMMAQARALPAAFAEQRDGRGWPQRALRNRSRLLADQQVVLVGFGSIARRLVELLAPMRPRVVGVRRTPSHGDPVPTIAIDDPALDHALSDADHVVDILPASPSTEGFFDARRLGALRPGAVFYNIGRGTTVDQGALLGALASGHLAAAYIDVTDPEPLPPEHPLWRAPNCVITPHTAGGHADEAERLVRHFLANLARYTSGQPLVDRVA